MFSKVSLPQQISFQMWTQTEGEKLSTANMLVLVAGSPVLGQYITASQLVIFRLS